MTYYITYLKDTIGNNYLGIKVPNVVVDPFLDDLKEILGDDFDNYTRNQQDRDHGNYHITVINTMDYNRLAKEVGVEKFVNSLETVLNYEIDDLEMLGVGTATKGDNTTYFVVCNSDKLDAVRTRFGLDKQDFHTTLGFKDKDVFSVRKNIVLKK
jgi:hypothetical protein